MSKHLKIFHVAVVVGGCGGGCGGGGGGGGGGGVILT